MECGACPGDYEGEGVRVRCDNCGYEETFCDACSVEMADHNVPSGPCGTFRPARPFYFSAPVQGMAECAECGSELDSPSFCWVCPKCPRKMCPTCGGEDCACGAAQSTFRQELAR